MDISKKLSKKKKEEIEDFLKKRFNFLKKLRDVFDEKIEEEVDLYNDIDKHINDKDDWEEKITVPYVYTIVQTMVARLIEALFGHDNYLKIFVEKKEFKSIEKNIQLWLQAVLDKSKLKKDSRDFIEDSLIERVSWIQPVPVKDENGVLKKIKLNILGFFDVWFDTKAKDVNDTDFFVKKIKKLYEVLQNKDIYFNLDRVKETTPPDPLLEKQRYAAKHDRDEDIVYYDPDKNNVTDEVELLEYYGVYDIGSNPDKPNYQEVIFVLANREVLIRAETNDFKTDKKRLLFPIRPLRQSKSLIGKSVPQLIKNIQYELNETRSLRLQNFKTLIQLLFKYRRDADIDFDELFAKGGNAIGYGGDPKDIDIFQVPDKTREASFMSGDAIQDMQQITGAVDYLMGTSAARGVTETASGIKQITDQALFKFGMMARNVYDDLLELINFIMILWIREGTPNIILFDAELSEFVKQSETELENSYVLDIGLNDLAMRRDIERSQFINAINIILPILMQVGGNTKELLRQTMERLNMENIDEIMALPPEEEKIIQTILPILKQNPQLVEQILALGEGQKDLTGASPASVKKSTPEEEVYNINTEKEKHNGK